MKKIALIAAALIFALTPLQARAQSADAKALQEQVEQRIAMLQSELMIQNHQEKAFAEYAQALRGVSLKLIAYQQVATRKMQTGTAPDKFDTQLGVMRDHLKDMEAMGLKLKALYKVLTPDQRAVADQIAVMPMM